MTTTKPECARKCPSPSAVLRRRHYSRHFYIYPALRPTFSVPAGGLRRAFQCEDTPAFEYLHQPTNLFTFPVSSRLDPTKRPPVTPPRVMRLLLVFNICHGLSQGLLTLNPALITTLLVIWKLHQGIKRAKAGYYGALCRLSHCRASTSDDLIHTLGGLLPGAVDIRTVRAWLRHIQQRCPLDLFRRSGISQSLFVSEIKCSGKLMLPAIVVPRTFAAPTIGCNAGRSSRPFV